jgi:hypothetical protein
MDSDKKPCLLCNDTGFVMQAEEAKDADNEVPGKPEILVPTPCPKGCVPPQKQTN